MYKTIVRPDNVCGQTDWLWPEIDTGAWTGPVENWDRSHRHKYFTHVKQKRVCVTAGANCGLHTRFYKDMFQTTYAFEPDALNFHCMVNNTQADNVIKMQMALGDEHKLISLVRPDMHNLGCHRVNSDNNDHMIPMITLDSLNLIDVDLIQLDVEGFEYKILLGARKTISTYRPVIIVENGRTDEIEEFMRELNYVFVEQSESDWIYRPI